MVAEQHCSTTSAISAEYMQRVGEQPSELPVEEWNLLPLVYKNAVGSRRAAWRVITSTEQEEKFKGKEELVLHAREHVAKVEGELQKIRDGILALMDKKLVPSAGTDETKMSYYRMKSDCYRYLAEFATGETKGKADEDAFDACVEANQIAEKDLVVSHPVRLATALDFSAFRSEVFQNPDEASQMACVAFEDASTSPVDQIAQKTIEIPRLRRIGNVIDIPVVQVEHVPESRVAEKTVEITQLDVVEKIVETPEIKTGHGIQDKIQQRTVAQIVDVPVQQFAEEQAQVSKVFSQNRVQQGFRGQTAETPDISLAEKTVEMPDTRTQDKTQHVVNTHGQHVVNTVEAEKPFINETINQVTMHVEIPQLQIVEKTVEAAKHIQQERVKELRSKFEVGHTSEVPRPIRSVQKTVEVPRVQYIDKVADIPVDMQRQVSTTQAAQDIEEVEDVPALTQSEVPNITDDDEDWLEQESKKRKLPMPAAVSESRADESDFDRFDGLVLPSPEGKTFFVNIASGDEAEDEPEKQQEMTRSLVQGGELMVMDETDAQGPEHEMVQAMRAEWVQELRDVKNELMHVRELVGVLVRRERFAENKAEVAARRLDRMEREQTEADDAEHEANLQEALANQSKAVKVVVDKWFVDKGYGFGKAPKGEIVFIHASAVQGAEVLMIGTDAWVQVVNDDARAQGGYRAKRAWGRNAWKAERDKENANNVAQQVRRAAALTAELAAQSEKKTAAVCDQPPGLDELAGHIEAPNMGAGGSHPQATMMPDSWATYERPSANKGQAMTSAPPEANEDTFALAKGFRKGRSRSASRNVETRSTVDSIVDEALDYYVKATGRDGTQKRQELVNMRPGELRRSLEHWQARAKDLQHLHDKKEHAWNLYSRVPNFRLKNKENFEEDFKHRAVYNGKVNERKLQEWIDEMQPKVHAAERQLEIRDRKREREWMESEDSSSHRQRAWEKMLQR